MNCRRTLGLIWLTVSVSFGQAVPSLPSFDAASVKPANPGDLGGATFQFMPGGGLKIMNATLRGILETAYGVREFQITRALTSISQRQFWTNIDLSQFGNGRVPGILSVDISDWETPGDVYGKPAREFSAAEIKEEVWSQLKQHLNDGGGAAIEDSNLLAWFLNPDIEFPNPGSATNAEPLLINTAGPLQYRPEAQIEIENFFLASDYVRTCTDLACMEAANEAARRAVNCLLLAAGSSAAAAQLWPLEEPAFLKPLQEIDRIRFGLGMAHH